MDFIGEQAMDLKANDYIMVHTMMKLEMDEHVIDVVTGRLMKMTRVIIMMLRMKVPHLGMVRDRYLVHDRGQLRHSSSGTN